MLAIVTFTLGAPLPAHAAPKLWDLVTLHDFDGRDGAFPVGPLVAKKPGGTFYGTTQDGGDKNAGTVYAIEPSGDGFEKIYSFKGGKDGEYPSGGLIYEGGYLYGVTRGGGDFDDGTVFRIDPNDAKNPKFTLHSFKEHPDGRTPQGELIAVNNLLFGTTVLGGDHLQGTVYVVDPHKCGKKEGSCAEEIIYSFKGGADDGRYPAAALIYFDNKLLSTTERGGANDQGTVFAVNTQPGDDILLHSFDAASDGGMPKTALVLQDRKLEIYYGTTFRGGNNLCNEMRGCGTVFTLRRPGHAPDANQEKFKFKTVHIFDGRSDDGAHPRVSLVKGGKYLYGAADNDGGKVNMASGLVFRIPTVGHKIEPLHIFTGADDGARPRGEVYFQGDGAPVYGTTSAGGDMNECNKGGCGTIYKLSPLK